MHLAFNDDQAALLGVLDQMLRSDAAGFRAAEGWARLEYGADLDGVIAQNGFYEAAALPDLGPVVAAQMIWSIAQAPVVVECAVSALLRPMLGEDLPRPIAVTCDEARGPIRFLPMARTLVSITDGGVRLARLDPDQFRPVDSLYAYPMGALTAAPDWQVHDHDPQDLRRLWSIAVAAELCGVLQGGMNAVLDHVRTREQFGQPLGSFQGVQHRLAQDAVQIEAAHLQTLRAADSTAARDAWAALGYAQQIATRIGYDLHQFMGAMGLTLEHPLHRWTYRARLLRADLGGANAAHQAYATERWGAT